MIDSLDFLLMPVVSCTYNFVKLQYIWNATDNDISECQCCEHQLIDLPSKYSNYNIICNMCFCCLTDWDHAVDICCYKNNMRHLMLCERDHWPMSGHNRSKHRCVSSSVVPGVSVWPVSAWCQPYWSQPAAAMPLLQVKTAPPTTCSHCTNLMQLWCLTAFLHKATQTKEIVKTR